MSDLYEFTVEWPSSTAQSVIITGDFDQWSKSLHLTRSTSTGTFTGIIKVPYGSPTRYKFIVDGEWVYRHDLPTERAPEGYVNNVHYVPLKDPLEAQDKPQDGTAERFISELADTIAARNGTSSALEYVTSGLGKTIQNVVGVDPVNSGQIAIPTPSTAHPSSGPPSPAPNTAESTLVIPATNGDASVNPESEHTSAALRTGDVGESDPAVSSPQPSESGPMVAPIVPIPIIPVYAKENCTIDLTNVAADERATPTFVGFSPPARKDESKAEGETEKMDIILPQIPLITTSTSTPPEEPTVAGASQGVPVVEDTPVEEKAESGPPAAAVVSAKPAAEEKAPIVPIPIIPLTATSAPTALEEPAVVGALQGGPVVEGAPVEEKVESAPPAPVEETPKATEGATKVETASIPLPSSPSKSTNGTTAPDAKEHTKSMSEASTIAKSSSRPTTPTRPSAASALSTPASTVNRKSKAFPQLGRGSSKDKGTVDELGVGKGNGTSTSKKKRTSSLFGKLKHLFHHEKEGEKEKGTH